MSLTYGANYRSAISFAKVQIVGSKNEDRDHFFLAEVGSEIENMSSFAVFDGHGGANAANVCAENIRPFICESFTRVVANISRPIDVHSYLRNEDIADIIITEAINEGINALHDNCIRTNESDGTTLCSLFLVPAEFQQNIPLNLNSSKGTTAKAPLQATDLPSQELGRSYKAICANVGDSRCVMVSSSAEPASLAVKRSSTSKWPFSSIRSSPSVANLASSGGGSEKRPAFPASSSSLHLRTRTSDPSPPSATVFQKMSAGDEPNELEYTGSGTVSGAPRSPRKKTGVMEYFQGFIRDYGRPDDELAPTVHSTPPVHEELDDELLADETQAEEDFSALDMTVHVKVCVQPMSEDHKPSNLRERVRVEKRVPIGRQVLPVPLKALARDEDFVQIYCSRHYDQPQSHLGRKGEPLVVGDTATLAEIEREIVHRYGTLPNLDALQRNVRDITELNEVVPIDQRFANQLMIDFDSPIFGYNIDRVYRYRLFAAVRLMESLYPLQQQRDQGHEDQKDSANEITPVRQYSGFERRRGRSGKLGPEAYFGRWGDYSLLMTRSIGDALGPRGCLARADLTSVNIHASQHARFVIASDGVWDVISHEFIRMTALLCKHKLPQDYAVFVAEQAAKRRADGDLSRDDITVFVVDVNPHCAVFIKTGKTDPESYYPAYSVSSKRRRTPFKRSIFSTSNSPSSSLKVKPIDREEDVVPVRTVSLSDYERHSSGCIVC